MTKAKATTTDNPENSIQALKEGTCPTSNSKSTLGYQVGTDDPGSAVGLGWESVAFVVVHGSILSISAN